MSCPEGARWGFLPVLRAAVGSLLQWRRPPVPRPALPLPLFLGPSVPSSWLAELESASCSLPGLMSGPGGHPGNRWVSALGTWEAAGCFSGSRKCRQGLPNLPPP